MSCLDLYGISMRNCKIITVCIIITGLRPYQPREEEDNSLWDALTFFGFGGLSETINKVVKEREHIYYISVYTMGQIECCKYPWQSCFTLCWAGWGETCILTMFTPSLENWICLSTNHYLHVSEVKSDKKGTLIVGNRY